MINNTIGGEKILCRAKVHWRAALSFHIKLMNFIVGFITIIFAVIKYLPVKLYFTDRYIYGKTGYFKSQKFSYTLDRVNVTVDYDMFGVGEIYKFGTIFIYTPAGKFIFKYTFDPGRFAELLHLQIDEYIKNKKADQL